MRVKGCRVVGVAVAAILAGGSAASAEVAPGLLATFGMRQGEEEQFVQPVHSLEASAMLIHRDYKELDIEPGKSTEEGFVPGFDVRYTYQSPTPTYRFFFRTRFHYADSDIDFDGTDQAGRPVGGESGLRIVNPEGNLGWTIDDPSYALAMTFYSGFGYWRWDRDLGGAIPFEEDYDRLYVPLGLRTVWSPCTGCEVGFDATVEFMIDGAIDIQLPGFPEVELDLGNDESLRVEIPLAFQVTDHLSLHATPLYRYIQINRSETGTLGPFVIFEPESRTHEYGGNVGFRVTF